MKKNIVIIILSVLVLALGGYLVYDKVIDKKSSQTKTEEPAQNEEPVFEEKNVEYLNTYLKDFFSCNGYFVSRDTEDFTDQDIYYFVSNHYINEAINSNIKPNESGEYSYSYKFTKEKADELVYRYFNRKTYNIENSKSGITITRNGNEYTISWSAVGCGYSDFIEPQMKYNGKDVTVTYNVYDGLAEEYVGTQTFYLKYNNGNYNVIKITTN